MVAFKQTKGSSTGFAIAAMEWMDQLLARQRVGVGKAALNMEFTTLQYIYIYIYIYTKPYIALYCTPYSRASHGVFPTAESCRTTGDVKMLPY